ncbi:MAG: hypothetical protein ACERJ1_08315 [Halodesulfovibrio sp.]|uniref:hypothetical protein n=1 Tax=Halodesulfovibrio sp. TaxID=1912772 RepID=UPI00359D7426
MDTLRRTGHCLFEKVLGVLVPYERDDQFNILKVSVACAGEREVIIENLSQHLDMLEFLREPVLLEGIVTCGEAIETINVKKVIPFVNSDFFNNRKRI